MESESADLRTSSPPSDLDNSNNNNSNNNNSNSNTYTRAGVEGKDIEESATVLQTYIRQRDAAKTLARFRTYIHLFVHPYSHACMRILVHSLHRSMNA